MNFSEVLKVCGGPRGACVEWSPDGHLVTWPTTPVRLEVRDATSLQVVVTFTCQDAIQEVEWSPDSCYILTASYKRGVVEVWSLEDPDWKCKVDEGGAGVIKARWAPDSRHILTTAEFYLQVTVWSLINKTASHICHLKASPLGQAFSPDGEYLVVAERRDCKDYLSLLETKSWQLVISFQVCTRDLVGVLWGGRCASLSSGGDSINTGSVLAVWDSPLQYKVAMYSLTGHCLGTYSAYQMALGVREVNWSPSGQFLAVSSYDNQVRLLNHLTLGAIAEFPHSTTITSATTVYREHRTPLTGYPSTLASAASLHPPLTSVSYEEETTRPITLATLVDSKGVPTASSSSLLFSFNGRFLATRRQDMPATVWVWDVAKVALKAVLVHQDTVKDMAWDPKQSRLAVCTGGSHLYFWTPLGSVTVGVPKAPHLHITSIKWHPYGQSMALIGKNYLSVCFLDPSHHPFSLSK